MDMSIQVDTSARALLVHRLKVAMVIVAVSSVFMLAGCAKKPTGSVSSHGPATTGGTYNPAELQKALNYWGKRYQADRKDRDAALGYASALRKNGQLDQAIAVLRFGMIQHGKDRLMASAYGKALAAKGQFAQALRVIQSAQLDDRPDWRLMSAEGAILDQTGKHADARRVYKAALKVAPSEPSILNNLGLSYTLTNELKKAEGALRKANASPNAGQRIRQNLALVLGLQGKFKEAERMATADLPPEQAQANIAYLRSMLSQRNSWKDIKRS